MKRKLILLVGCFVLLLLAFGTYRFFLPDAVGTTGQSVRTMLDWGKIDPDRPSVGHSQGVRFFDINSEGALRGIYRADSLSKEDDGSWTLQAPTAEVHLPDNKRVYLSADRGRLWAQEVAEGFDVRRGTMEGNVKIYYDQSTDYERLHPQERMEKDWEAFRNEVMTISTSNIEFSRHMLEIYTPDRVDVWSKEVNLHGRDLRIQWNESPRELRELKLSVVDKLIIKQMPQPMDPLPLESEGADEAPDAAARANLHLQTPLAFYPASSQLVYQTDDMEDVWNLPDAPPTPDEQDDAAAPDSDGTDTAVEEEQPAESDQADAATPPSGTKDSQADSDGVSGTPVRPDSASQQQPTRKARNIYQATCSENVRVTNRQDNASITGAEEIAWTFEWAGNWRGDDDEDEEEASDDEAVSETQEQSDAAEESAETDADEATEATPEDREDDTDNRMEINCDGPLVIRPVGATDDPSRDHYILSGHGERVILSSDRGRALCKTFTYDNAKEQITIAGNSKVPSRLLLANGDEIICRDEIEVFGKQEKAFGRGPGTMNHFEETTREDAWESILAGEADQRQIDAQIYWAGGVEIDFGSEVLVDENGEQKRELYFKKATFEKRVQLARRAVDAEGRKTRSFDHVKCDHLAAIIDRADNGQPYISRADATGDVAGRWSGAEFTTREATLYLEPAPEDEPAEDEAPATAEAGTEDEEDEEDDDATLGFTGLAKMQLRRMRANGDVYVRQQGRATIKAESVDMTRSEGPESPWSIDADGAGELQFSSKRGMGGEEYDVPRHVRIRWSKRMDFDGLKDLATFEGDIRFDSGDDTMSAEKMLLYLAEAEPETQEAPAADEEDAAGDDPLLGMGVGDIASRDISRIEIVGNPDGPAEAKQAVLNRTRFDPAMPQVVLQRMELRGERVIYTVGKEAEPGSDAATPSIVKVVGAGQFSHEDYQPLTEEEKQKAKTDGADPMALAGQRPSQTACKWLKGMELNQETNHLQLWDSVTMVYRSGDEILKIKGLQTPIWKKLPEGRASTIRCDKLDGWFEDAADTDGQAAAGTEMLEGVEAMGSLTRVEARKDVTMVDGPVTIDAQRIIYDAVEKTVNVWGYEEGEPQADARISRVNPDTGRTTANTSPFLKWIMGTDDRPEKIVTGKVSGGGGM
jgi:lipopolysaccharide export system protein LptA